MIRNLKWLNEYWKNFIEDNIFQKEIYFFQNIENLTYIFFFVVKTYIFIGGFNRRCKVKRYNNNWFHLCVIFWIMLPFFSSTGLTDDYTHTCGKEISAGDASLLWLYAEEIANAKHQRALHVVLKKIMMDKWNLFSGQIEKIRL